MQLLDNQLHGMIKSHPFLTEIRKATKRGTEVVIYRHKKTGNYILAETNGRVVREIAVLKGFPTIGKERFQQLCAQLRPLPYRQRNRNRELVKQTNNLLESNRNKGRFLREHTFNMRKAAKGNMKSHPMLNWPTIKGEGI